MNEQDQTIRKQEQHQLQGEPAREETDGELIARWEENATAVATSIDVATEEGRLMVSRCMGTADLKTRALVGQVVEAVGFFAHVAEITNNETGEMSKKIRCVLLLADGRTISTMSKACVRQISMWAKMRNGKKWDPPVFIETREYPLEKGKSYCDMREVGRPLPAKAKKV